MPSIRLGDDLETHYYEDDFSDPWVTAEPVVFVHGLAESGAVWYAWVPHFARHHRVLRPDLRGFGGSSVPADPLTFAWGPRVWADDLARLLEALDAAPAHLVAARVGSTVALQLAAERPALVRTLSIVSGLARGGDLTGLSLTGGGRRIAVAAAPQAISELGLQAYVEATNQARLGSEAPPELVAWSSALQAASNPEAVRGVLAAASRLDLTDRLGRVQAPTLVLAAADSTVQTLEATRGWQTLIPNSRLESLPGDSPHLAALHPDECARRVRAFIASAGRA